MATSIDYDAIDIGDEAPGIEVNFNLDQVKGFLGAWNGRVDSANSRFTNRDQAEKEGFGGNAIIPGRLGLAVIARAVQEWMPDGRIEKLDVVFRAPTLQETKHTASAMVTDKTEDDSEIRYEIDVYLEREGEDALRPQRGAAVVVVKK